MTAPADGLAILDQAGRLFEAGQLDDTAALLAQVNPADSAYPYALYLHAMVLAALGQRRQCCDLLEQACRQCPDNHAMHAARARIHAELGRPAEALALLSALADAGTASAATELDRGALARQLGKPDLAMACFEAALAMDAGLADAWSGKANLLHESGDYDQALRCHDAALAAQPDNVPAICNRIATLSRLDRLEEALAESRRAVALSPHHPGAWSACGCTLALLDRLEEAMHCFDQALQLDPQHRHAHANRASTLAELGDVRQALERCEAALRMARRHPSELAALNTRRGMLQLLLGDWTGWTGYEHRLFHDPATVLHDSHAPRWTGSEPLIGKRILLWSEQGLGDTIQFCRYASDLHERGAIVLLEVPPSLLTLCRQLPATAVYARGEPIPQHDFQIPMMSMPLALGRQAGIPHAEGYLRASDHMVRKWASQLPRRSDRPRIGIVCSGSTRHQRNARRSIPLIAFKALSEHAELIVLQPELTANDSASLIHMPEVLRAEVDIGEFADVAGLIANTDLVVSVDTAIAHLAGAMGHPLWLLLPWHAEWRWMTERQDTPWYANARLFRQSRRGCWDTVIAEAVQALLAAWQRRPVTPAPPAHAG